MQCESPLILRSVSVEYALRESRFRRDRAQVFWRWLWWKLGRLWIQFFGRQCDARLESSAQNSDQIQLNSRLAQSTQALERIWKEVIAAPCAEQAWLVKSEANTRDATKGLIASDHWRDIANYDRIRHNSWQRDKSPQSPLKRRIDETRIRKRHKCLWWAIRDV